MSDYPVLNIGEHQLTLAKPDFNHPRIDRIVSQTNPAANTTEIRAITGTPAAEPAPPPCPSGWQSLTAIRIEPREPLCRVRTVQLYP